MKYLIRPGQKILTIVQLEDGSYKAVYLHWGLIPHWSKDNKFNHQLINARAETLAEKPAFKSAYRQRRCLIPATGFYEWQKTQQGKQAYCIAHQQHQLFAFAGLWEYWKHQTETIYSCTIITTAANELLSPIHQRMPVIVNVQNYNHWMNKQTLPEVTQQILANDAYSRYGIKASQ